MHLAVAGTLGTATPALAARVVKNLVIITFNGMPTHAHASVFLDLLNIFALKVGVCLILLIVYVIHYT